MLALLAPSPRLVDLAVSRGIDFLIIDSHANLRTLDIGAAVPLLAVDLECVDPTKLVECCLALAGTSGVDGVISLSEPGLLLSAQMNSLLGVADNSPKAVTRTLDKAEMRRRLEEVDPSLAVPYRVCAGYSEAVEFASQFYGKVVCKPLNGSGSVGVTLCNDLGDLPETGYPLLAEQRIFGREYSVEGFSYNGRFTLIGVTEKLLGSGASGAVEFGHIFPASHEVELAVGQLAATALAALGVKQGLTHTEIIMTESGPRVVETHTRHGGDHIVDLVQLAMGIDLVDLALTAKLMADPLPHAPSPDDRVAMIRFFSSPRSGRVVRVAGAQTLRFAPHVVDLQLSARRGQTVSECRSSLDRLGHVIVVASNRQEAEAASAHVLSSIRIEIA